MRENEEDPGALSGVGAYRRRALGTGEAPVHPMARAGTEDRETPAGSLGAVWVLYNEGD